MARFPGGQVEGQRQLREAEGCQIEDGAKRFECDRSGALSPTIPHVADHAAQASRDRSGRRRFR